MDQIRVRHLKPWIVAGLGALSISAVLILALATTASAGFSQFCYGVHVSGQDKWGGNPPGSLCDSYANDGVLGYVTEVAGAGTLHSVCVVAWYEGSKMCSGGPNQGVYNPTPTGKLLQGAQILNNSTGENVVSAYIVTCKESCVPEEEGGGGPPPPPPVRVSYADASNENTVSGWERPSGGSWKQTEFWGHHVEAGSSPETLEFNGTKHVFFVDASNSDTISDWSWNSSTGWQQTFLYGHPVMANSSPSGF